MVKDKRKNNSAPTKMTKEVLQKLEAWFSNSLTDEECCLYADINPSTLYRYIDKNPEFWKRKERLKKKPNIQAKVNWIKKINASDYQASKEWLERKSKDEFSMKTESDNKNELTWEIKMELPKIVINWEKNNDNIIE